MQEAILRIHDLVDIVNADRQLKNEPLRPVFDPSQCNGGFQPVGERIFDEGVDDDCSQEISETKKEVKDSKKGSVKKAKRGRPKGSKSKK